MNSARTSRALAAIVVLTIIILATIVKASAAGAAPPVAGTAVRSGDHSDFGRIVIDTSPKTEYTLDQDSDHVVVHLQNNIPLGSPPSPPRNVIGITTDGPTLGLVVRPGAQVRPWRMDGHIVLDIVDAASATPTVRVDKPPREPRPRPPLTMASSPERSTAAAAQVADPAPATSVPVVAQPLLPPSPSPPPSSPLLAPQPAAQPGVGELTQQTPPGRDVLPENEGPVGLRARRTRLPKEMDGTAFLVPFDTTTGVAAFQSSDSTFIVFDERRPVDMAALKADPVFGSASVQLLPTGTLLRVPHPAALSIALTQLQQGWRIAALASTPRQEPIVTSVADGRLNLAAEQPSDVVTMADPDTGATLLVGTQHRPGQGVLSARRSAEFILRPTLQGVVIEALSDAIVLKPVPAGFSLLAPHPALRCRRPWAPRRR
jgi:hypothetical protein